MTQQVDGASGKPDRADRASPEPASGLGHSATIPSAETAWLIERDNGGLEYANGRGWTRDYRDALRFPAVADARLFAERAYKMVWTGEEAAYFDWQDYTRIVEHRWG